MGRRHLGAVALVLIAGCALKAPGTSTAITGREGVIKSPKSSAQPTLKPSSGPVSELANVLSPTRRDALVTALHNFVAANRATQLTSAVRAAGGIISNNSGSIISDNGLGIISDNGLGYHVLAATPFTAETDALVYVITPIDDKTGGFKTYDKAAYKAAKTSADKEKALVDDFTWDDVTVTPKGLPPALTVEVAYHLKMVSSKRLPFTDRLISREIHQVTMTDAPEPDDKLIGWEIEFGMDVTLLDGQKDTASFKGVAGPNDITYTVASDGTQQAFPTRLALTGSHTNGSFTGTMAGTDYTTTTVEHVEQGSNKKTRLKVELKQGGAVTRTIDVPDQQLRVVLDADAAGQGTGKLYDTTTTEPKAIGTITWDATGLGAIAMDGTRLGESDTFQVRLF